MNIGFVTTWLERGATYVTKSYINLISDKSKVFIYARGGEYLGINKEDSSIYNIYSGLRLKSTDINWGDFSKWIKKNKLDIIFFNEQSNIEIVLKSKLHYPYIKLGCYIDYYTEKTIDDHRFYDFLICNTKRHFSVFKWHKQVYYVKWGTFPDLFDRPIKEVSDRPTFFHSMGLSTRKGTESLIETFISSKYLHVNSNLIIHTQLPISYFSKYDQLDKYNIQIISKEVPLPGLYHLGDVYVYPTTLDGLGLTMYEAMMAGLPLIVTDEAPMNEIIYPETSKLIAVERYHSRSDGYYWPLSEICKNSLEMQMRYYIENIDRLHSYKLATKKYALSNFNLTDRREQINMIFNTSEILNIDKQQLKSRLSDIKKLNNRYLLSILLYKLLPNKVFHYFKYNKERKEYEEKK
jgi:glycosyltransferase involved in cell wall biosynthesis